MDSDSWHEGIYDVLTEECGAYDSPDNRAEFAFHFPYCVEFRFMGRLGFGGKVWWTNGRLYVTCYGEDKTPERSAMIERANARLSAFVETIPA